MDTLEVFNEWRPPFFIRAGVFFNRKAIREEPIKVALLHG